MPSLFQIQSVETYTINLTNGADVKWLVTTQVPPPIRYSLVLVPTDEFLDFSCRWYPQPTIPFPSQVTICCKSGRQNEFAVVLTLLAAWHTEPVQHVATLFSSATTAVTRVSCLGLVTTNIQGALANSLNFCHWIWQSVSVSNPLIAGFRTGGKRRALRLQSENSTVQDSPNYTSKRNLKCGRGTLVPCHSIAEILFLNPLQLFSFTERACKDDLWKEK